MDNLTAPFTLKKQMDAQTARLLAIKILFASGKKVNFFASHLSVAQMIVGGQAAMFLKSKGQANRVILAFIDQYLADGHELPDGVEDLRQERSQKQSSKQDVSANKFYKSFEWASVRYAALQQHGGACQCCGAKAGDGVTLHVDHIKPRSKYPELALDINNMQVLCFQCNYGKYNRDQTDWRQPKTNGGGSRTGYLGMRAHRQKSDNVVNLAIKIEDIA